MADLFIWDSSLPAIRQRPQPNLHKPIVHLIPAFGPEYVFFIHQDLQGGIDVAGAFQTVLTINNKRIFNLTHITTHLQLRKKCSTFYAA